MYDLAVIGAGPAGMAAAVSAADSGLAVVVIDEQTRAGGQIFRQPPVEFTDAKLKPTAGYGWATELITRFETHTSIKHLASTTAYGILRDRDQDEISLKLAVSGPEFNGALPARRLLIATGAYDLPVAFPGWTLPGVMTAGAVQSLLKSQRVLAGDDLVLAGSHPLLVIVADQLVAKGARVAELAFARGIPTPRELVAARRAVPGHADLLAESALAVARLVARGVKISTRTIVTGAFGDRCVESVELAKVDRNWKVSTQRRRLATSTLVLGYGFSPSTELARQANCDMVWNSPKGGWVVAHDSRMETSAPGIFVAGEPTGVGGADQARAEGALAGLAIARELSAPDAPSDKAFAQAQDNVGRAENFSSVVQTMFEPKRDAMTTLATPETTICRCELVTRAVVQTTLDDNPFISTASAVKLQCRSGMGPCQGRYCEGTVSGIVSAEREVPLPETGYFTAHLPVKPVPVQSLTWLDS
ncbi:MAG: FAD-dependent oxidoreductase [Rhodococcus sp. (in: high G+C Gram-positive bacteria)]|uniref:FAD/NAD(P)-dependent oxidoreductase n=1 Tax=Rhodococcus sp. TaxID=1831 RepID=UPI00120D775A|nr:NAD(P)/FAD-dependent oxidoreductase [Rhodococcus sp. (in: high G+C Gram-positive bacteria)]RZL24719.1 MAG: FAD-dependent oxidoreductase [Rhodococcus sp. (in: high G+C Gram-positive bacteria)]